jgi:sarcosine oxidase, subunit alpha
MAAGLVGLPTVELWTGATAVGVFADRRIGVVRHGGYWLIEPEVLLVATGARERQLLFPGHTLPGVYGAGAFQTLLNRDGVVPCRRLLLVGGGNVGLIAAYHALQADIEVVGLVELMPEVGGYRVHADKLRRLGVPVHLSHTIVAVHGRERVEATTVAAVDDQGRPISGTERSFAVDAVLVAAGLAPLDELAIEARECGSPMSGPPATPPTCRRLRPPPSAAAWPDAGWLRSLGRTVEPVPASGRICCEASRAAPGPAVERPLASRGRPVSRVAMHPGDPLQSVRDRLPAEAIEIDGDPIRGLPRFNGDRCTGCSKCVAVCPGLAITLVDRRSDPGRSIVTIPFELDARHVRPGSLGPRDGRTGHSPRELRGGRREGPPIARPHQVGTDPGHRRHGAAHRRHPRPGSEDLEPIDPVPAGATPDDVIVCRCEHVTAGEIRAAIRSGIHDVNEFKTTLRVCMGACCGKNCPEHIAKLYRDEGIPLSHGHRAHAPTPVRRSADRRVRPWFEGRAWLSTGYDAVVIGSGSVGTPIGLSLAEAGLSVGVFDPGPSPGRGDNRAAIGGIRATHSEPAKATLCTESIEVFSGWLDARGDDIEWRRGGYLFAAFREHDAEALRAVVATQQSAGLDIDWVGPERVAELVPGIDPGGLLGGTFSPGDGSASP